MLVRYMWDREARQVGRWREVAEALVWSSDLVHDLPCPQGRLQRRQVEVPGQKRHGEILDEWLEILTGL